MKLMGLVDRVREAARTAAEQSRQVNMGDIWERLMEIDTEAVQERIDNRRPHGWPGAVPVWEPITTWRTTYDPPVPLIGVDGSQVYAVSDHPVRWAYIQASAYPWQDPGPVSSQFLDIRAIERFMITDEEGSRWNSRAYVDAQRTLLEVQVAKAAAQSQPEAVILLDNPLLPFGTFWGVAAQFLPVYTETLAGMQGANLAGYVSCPRSHLLYNLLRLADDEFDPIKAHRIFTDAEIMRYGLSIGQRSAIFLHGSRRNFELEQAGAGVYFFFLKLSETEVARVELPDWAARSPETLDRIQSSILADSRGESYPSALLMAHTAVEIPIKTSWQLNQLALQAYLAQGGYFCVSAKKQLKRRIV